VKDCPDANDEQKKELLKRKWKEWKAEKREMDSQRMNSLRPMDCATNLTRPTGVEISRLSSSDVDCRFPVQFAPNLVRSMLADTGSDTSAFTLQFLDVLREHVRVDYEEFPSPVLHAVAESPYEQEKPNYVPQCGWATVSCDILLNCGPLRVPKWRFAVIRGEMQEGILGRDFPKEVMGLDLNKIFEDAAQTRAASAVVDTSDSIEFVVKNLFVV
jgi:hypothetical protein